MPDRLTVPVMPAIPAVETPGWFTPGDPQADIPATPVRAWWLNMITAELKAVVEAAGLVLDKADNTQLLQAVNALIADGMPSLANVAYLNVEQLFTKAQGSAAVPLAEAAPVVIDTDLSNLFTLALTASRTIGNCDNVVLGRPFAVLIQQPVGGGCGLAFEANWQFENDEAPANTTTPNAIDLLIGIGLPAGKVFGHLKQNIL
ncbi:MAG: hypothetical protein ACK4Q4_00805 [Rhodocyclaceae bacterium]